VSGAGSRNSAVGYAALDDTSANENTAMGYTALESDASGANNAAVGSQALRELYSASNCVAFGAQALTKSVTGGNNTALGCKALAGATTGSNNIAIGYQAGINLTTGSNNIEIGNVVYGNESNGIHLGTQGVQTRAVIAGIFGTTATSGVPVYVTSGGLVGTLTSSAKYKRDIKPMGHASDVLMALKPVTFEYKPEIDPSATPQFGLIAEEVEKVDPQLVVHDAEHAIYSVRYEAVNAMVLNEVQKQHETIDAQEKTIAEAKAALAEEKAHAQVQDKTIAGQQKLLQSLAERLAAVEKVAAK
jgi:hypothetical protein